MTLPTEFRASRRALLRAGAAVPVLALSGCGFFDTLFHGSLKKKLPGVREDVIPVTEGLAPSPVNPITVTLPPPTATDYPVEGGTPDHVGGNQALPATLTEAWSGHIGLGSGYRHQITATPIVADGMVFAMDSDATVSAFRASDGKRLWDLPTRPKKMSGVNIGGGLGYAGGTLYVTTGFAQLIAIDAVHGVPRFVHTFNVPIRSAPTPVADLVYFVTIDEVLVAASAHDGHQMWNYEAAPADTTLLGHPAPAVAEGFVVAGFGSGDLVTCSALSGSVVWTDNIATTTGQAGITQITAISGRPIIAHGIVAALGTGGLMVGEDLRVGRRLWERQVSGYLDPVAAGDFVFITSHEQVAAALSIRTGEVAWVCQLPQYKRPKTQGGPYSWTGVTLANNKLIYTSLQRRFLMVDAITGKLGGMTHIPGQVSVPPVAAGDTLYVITDDGRIRAFR